MSAEESLFPFPSDPRLEGQKWTAFACIFAVIATLQYFFILYTLFACPKCALWRAVSSTCILLGSLSRAIFYIAVPFYARKLLPAAVVGVLYGVSYPMVNGAVSGVVLAMAEQLRDLHVFQKKEKLAEQLSGLLPTLRAFIAVAGILNILLQATTDTLRTLGNGGKGLLVSRIYYLVYGAFLLLGLFSLLVEASRDYSMKKMKGTLDEMRRISLSIAVLYTLLLTYESVFLAAYEYIFKDGDDDWYFAALLIQQVLYCLLFLTLSIIVYRAAIRHRKKRQDVKRDDINVVENKNMETKLELPDEKGLKRASIAESEVPRQTSISIQNINNTLEHFGPYYGQGPDGVNTLNHRPARQKRHGSILNRDTDVLFSPARKKHLAVPAISTGNLSGASSDSSQQNMQHDEDNGTARIRSMSPDSTAAD